MYHGYFDAIKGISPQALEDFKSLKQEHCAILYPVKDFVSFVVEALVCFICFEFRINSFGYLCHTTKVYESLLKELNGRETVVKPEDAYQYLQRWGFRQADMLKILQKVDEIQSLDEDRKARLITFLKAIKNKSTLDEIKAAFVSTANF